MLCGEDRVLGGLALLCVELVDAKRSKKLEELNSRKTERREAGRGRRGDRLQAATQTTGSMYCVAEGSRKDG